MDQALSERSDPGDLLQRRQAIGDAHLDRPQPGDRADVPADFSGVLDDAGMGHVLHALLEPGPIGELEGQAGSRQLLEDQRPLRGVPGVLAGPVRRGGREREEMRVEIQQPIDHGHRLRLIVEPHMDMHAVDHHLPPPPLRAADQLGVALLIGHGLLSGRSEGVRALGVEFDAEALAVCEHIAGGLAQRADPFIDTVVDAGDDLHSVRQQLLLDVGVLLVIRQAGHVATTGLQDGLSH